MTWRDDPFVKNARKEIQNRILTLAILRVGGTSDENHRRAQAAVDDGFDWLCEHVAAIPAPTKDQIIGAMYEANGGDAVWRRMEAADLYNAEQINDMKGNAWERYAVLADAVLKLFAAIPAGTEGTRKEAT